MLHDNLANVLMHSHYSRDTVTCFPPMSTDNFLLAVFNKSTATQVLQCLMLTMTFAFPTVSKCLSEIFWNVLLVLAYTENSVFCYSKYFTWSLKMIGKLKGFVQLGCRNPFNPYKAFLLFYKKKNNFSYWYWLNVTLVALMNSIDCNRLLYVCYPN